MVWFNILPCFLIVPSVLNFSYHLFLILFKIIGYFYDHILSSFWYISHLIYQNLTFYDVTPCHEQYKKHTIIKFYFLTSHTWGICLRFTLYHKHRTFLFYVIS
jgi:hypothetical protein